MYKQYLLNRFGGSDGKLTDVAGEAPAALAAGAAGRTTPDGSGGRADAPEGGDSSPTDGSTSVSVNSNVRNAKNAAVFKPPMTEHELVASYGRRGDALLRRKKTSSIASEFVGLSVSVIIPAKYETDFLVKTLFYLYEITPFDLLAETIVIDDQSDEPLEPIVEEAFGEGGILNSLSSEQKASIKIIRNDHRQGLIRAKIQGADAAIGTHIFFLDGHCRPFENWLEPLLHRSLGNYKRIVVPTIPDVEAKDWSKKPNIGIKMMFEWNFHFDWFDDAGDEVPILSGGLLLITKAWWKELGRGK